MSPTARWIIAVLIIFTGIVFAAFAVIGGAFSTIACQNIPPDWSYYLLIIASLIIIAAATVPAVLLIRRVTGFRIIIALALGVAFSCVGYASYLFLLGENC